MVDGRKGREKGAGWILANMGADTYIWSSRAAWLPGCLAGELASWRGGARLAETLPHALHPLSSSCVLFVSLLSKDRLSD